jgi:hypothetical protein
METTDSFELTIDIKKQLLSIVHRCFYRRKNSPLMVAMSRTTNSLQQCFEGTVRKIYIRYMYDVENYTQNQYRSLWILVFLTCPPKPERNVK